MAGACNFTIAPPLYSSCIPVVCLVQLNVDVQQEVSVHGQWADLEKEEEEEEVIEESSEGEISDFGEEESDWIVGRSLIMGTTELVDCGKTLFTISSHD